MDAKKQNKEYIDLREVAKKLISRKRLFIKVWLITIVVAALIIFPVPRTYTTELSLVPEMGNEVSGGALSSLASSFGINMGNMQTNDAFNPELYPDIVSTNEFIVDLLQIQVQTIDGEISTTYYDYLKNHQKETFYMIPIKWAKKQIGKLLSSKDKTPSGEGGKINPRRLSKDDQGLVEGVRNMISCSIDKKTYVITISVEDQDPLICANMADSVRVRLQEFITDYRTSKARVDMNYYQQLTDSARKEYQKALEAYSRYADSHQNAILQMYLTERDALENEVQIKLNAYNAMNTQYEAAKAKVQERTPAFTILQSSSVPIKPTHPKRIIFIVFMLFVTTIGTGIHIFKKDILDQVTHLK